VPLPGQYADDEVVRMKASGTSIKTDNRFLRGDIWDGTPQGWTER
jgi:hypothetical protein